jgi:hypothetical protein
VVSNRYLRLADHGDRRAGSRWFGALEEVGGFALLDAYQLVKHYLGLRHTYESRPLTLVYLFWEPTNATAEPVFAGHRQEVGRFAQLVEDDQTCCFRALSYAEHWAELSQLAEPPLWLKHHLKALATRYLIDI